MNGAEDTIVIAIQTAATPKILDHDTGARFDSKKPGRGGIALESPEADA